MEFSSLGSQQKKKDCDECFIFRNHSTGLEFNADDKKEWEIKMFDMENISNANILNSTAYWVPLKIPFGDLLHKVKIGKHRVQHWLIVFECKFEEDNLFYLSFEKNKKGIIAQYSKVKDVVLENVLTEKRKYPKKIGTVKGGDLDFTEPLSKLIGLNELSVKTLIEKWEPVLEYILLESNCQTLVYDVNEVFSKISESEAVKFKFPGSSELISMSNKNRTSINDMITTYSGDCFKKEIFKVSSLPRVLVSIENTEFSVQSDSGRRYFEKEIKDKIDKLIDFSLKENNFKGMYFSNLNVNKMEINLKDGIKNEKNLDARTCADIAAFWCREIDGVILSEKYGVIIVETIVGQNEIEAETDKEIPSEIMLKELIKIGTVSIKEKMEVPITAMTIQIVEESLHYKVKRKNIKIEKKSLLEDFDDINKRFCVSFKDFLNKIKKKHTDSATEQMKFLAGCLLIFQNMADYKNVLFTNVINQKWETESNFIVWSVEQKPIIDEITCSFEKDNGGKANLYLISGCPGAGKTLILLHAVRYYCSRWPNKKVLIVVPEHLNSLHAQIRSKLKDLIEDGGKSVSICSRLNSENQVNVGLIAIDEFYWEMPEKLYEGPGSILDKANRNIHVIAATMEKINLTEITNYFFSYNVLSKDLKGANYRSDKAIIKLINEAQKNISDKYKIPLAVTAGSSSMTLSTEPVCLRYMTKNGFIKLGDKTTIEGDNTLERNDFIDSCVEYILSILKLNEGKILIYNVCHFSLLLRIKKKLETLVEQKKCITCDQFRNLEFNDSRECRGAEYAYSIGIYDHMSVPYDLYGDIIVGLTRTILSANLLINIATTVPDCYALDRHSSSKFEKLGPCITYFESDELDYFLSDMEHENKKVFYPKTKGFGNHPGYQAHNDMNGWKNADVIVLSPRNYLLFFHALDPIHSSTAMLVMMCEPEIERERDGFDYRMEVFLRRRGYEERIEMLYHHEKYKEKIRDLLVNRFPKATLE